MRPLYCLALALVITACTHKPTVSVKNYDGFPSDSIGYSRGVTAPFVAKINQTIILAGGCNFPNKTAANNGAKAFYNDIYRAHSNPNSSRLVWQKIGQLKQPMAYGASIETPDGYYLFVGGRNQEKVFDNISKVRYSETLDSLIIDRFPPMPKPRYNMGVAILEEKLYVVGGVVDGKPSNSVISIDLDATSSEQWNDEPDIPDSPRIQPVVVAQNEEIFVFGGFAQYTEGQNNTISLTAWKYHPASSNWNNINPPVDTKGDFIALSGGFGLKLNDKYIVLAGGFDKNVLRQELMREQKIAVMTQNKKLDEVKALNLLTKEYLMRPVEWHNFNGKVLLYDAVEDKYTQVANEPKLARANAACLTLKDGFMLISGNTKPGANSTDITRFSVITK